MTQITELIASLTIRGANRLADLGLTKVIVAQWIRKGLDRVECAGFKPEFANIVAEALVSASTVGYGMTKNKILRKDLFDFSLYLRGEESAQLFTDMQLRNMRSNRS